MIGSQSMAGWLVHQDFKHTHVTNNNELTRLDMSLRYNEELDH